MVGHKASLNKFKKIKIVSSTLRSQQYETRNQLQEEKWIKHKYKETKEHTTKKPVDQ